MKRMCMLLEHTCTFHLIYVNMKLYDFTVLYPYRPTNKNVVPAIIGAAAAIGSSLLTNAASKSAADSAYQKQLDYNQWLLTHQTQERVKDLRSAGLNPAFMNGSQLGSTPAPPSYDTPQYQSPLDLSSAMMFGKLASDTRLTNAQAKAQELLNADKESKNQAIAHTYDEGVWMLNGKPISDDEANELLSNGSTELPDFSIRSISPDGAEGRLQGEQLLKRWDKEVNDIDVGKLQNQLESMVTKGQISNPRVIQALQNMPYWTYKDLIEKVNNVVVSRQNMKKQGKILDITAATAQLEQDITRDNNLNQYIDKMFNGEFEIKDLCKVLTMAFLGCVSNFGGNLFKGSPQKTTTINIGTQN